MLHTKVVYMQFFSVGIQKHLLSRYEYQKRYLLPIYEYIFVCFHSFILNYR